MEIEIKTNMLS